MNYTPCECKVTMSEDNQTTTYKASGVDIKAPVVIVYCSLHAAAQVLLDKLKEAQEALDVLSDDAIEAGYEQRGENATQLAMECRKAIATAEGR